MEGKIIKNQGEIIEKNKHLRFEVLIFINYFVVHQVIELSI